MTSVDIRHVEAEKDRETPEPASVAPDEGYGVVRLPKPSPALATRRRVPRPRPPGPDADETATLLATFRSDRDRALAGLILYSGLRSTEVLRLKVSDVDIVRGWVRVAGMAGRRRRVRVGAGLTRLIRNYLLVERPDTDSPALFVATAGDGRPRPLTASGLRLIVRHHRAVRFGRSSVAGPARLALLLHPRAARALVGVPTQSHPASLGRSRPEALRTSPARPTNANDKTQLLPLVSAKSITSVRVATWPGERPGGDAYEPSATHAASRQRALAHVAWLAPTVLMATLGLSRLGWPGLWADELATWGMTTSTWSQMFAVLGHFDAVIGPYYLMIRCWAEIFGTSDAALRLPSVIAMTAAVALTARVGTRLATPRVGLLAGLLLALLPTTTRYAQEARPYAFTVFAAALATLLLVRALERPRPGRLIAYACALSFVGLCSAVAIILVGAHGCLVLLTRRAAFPRWMVCAALGVLPVIPILLLGAQQRTQVSWIPPTNLDRLAGFPQALFGLGVVAGVLLALALLSSSFRQPAVYYTTWAVVPTVGLYLASQITPLWLPRYLLFTLPAWALLGATALARAPVIRGVVAAVAVGLIGLPIQLDLRQADGHGQATRDAAALIERNVLAGDAIVYGDNAGVEGRAGRDLIARYIPANRRPVDLLVVAPPRTAGNFTATECADIAACLGRPPRIWVVRLGTYDNPLFQMGEAKANLLGATYAVESVWHPTGLTVALLLRKPT